MPPADQNRPKHPRLGTGPVTPVGVPLAIIEPETSQAYEDPDARQRYRARRTDAERIDRIERKQDDHSEKLATFGADLGELKGGVSTLVRLASERDERERESARARTEILEAFAKRRAAWWRGLFKILVPLVIAIGGIITGVVASRSSSAPTASHGGAVP